MVEDIVLDTFPKESGVYLFKANDEVIYVGSSNNLYIRMIRHRSRIKQGSAHGYQQDLYKYLQSNPFTVEFQITDNYIQLEQELVEKYNPIYNSHRAYTGLGPCKGRVAEYNKERYQKYKKEILDQKKQYYELHKEEISDQKKQYYELHKEEISDQKKQYNNQLCYYNGETITLCALSKRFRKAGIDHPTAEAKKYLIKKETQTPIEFYDVYP